MKSYLTMVVIAILALLSALVVVSASGSEGELSPASQSAADETTIQVEDLIKALEIKMNALESEIFGSSGYTGNPVKTNSIEGWIINLDQRVTDLESQLDAR
jgi:ABC-type bacteriocin/lantibiotic exporter with double-glycine peptidase domain